MMKKPLERIRDLHHLRFSSAMTLFAFPSLFHFFFILGKVSKALGKRKFSVLFFPGHFVSLIISPGAFVLMLNISRTSSSLWGKKKILQMVSERERDFPAFLLLIAPNIF